MHKELTAGYRIADVRQIGVFSMQMNNMSPEQLKSQADNLKIFPRILFWVFNLTLLILCAAAYYTIEMSSSGMGIRLDATAYNLLILFAGLSTLGALSLPELLAKLQGFEKNLIALFKAATAEEQEAALSKLQFHPSVRSALLELDKREQIEMLVRGPLLVFTILRLVFSETITIFGFVLAGADNTWTTILPFTAVSLAVNFLHTKPKLSDEYVVQTISRIEAKSLSS